MSIGIVGLGYVGPPLAVGLDVIGLDVDHGAIARDAKLLLDLRGVTRELGVHTAHLL